MIVTVDFCRGSGGAFLAVNGVVVAGEANGDGSGRLIQAFAVNRPALVRALQTEPVETVKSCKRCDTHYPHPAPSECDHCGGPLT